MASDSIMKDKRRYLRAVAIMLAAACLILPLAGCGGGDSHEEDPLPDDYEPPVIDKLERTDLKFLFPGSEPKNWKKVKEEIEKRTGGLNISLDFRWIEYSEYYQMSNILDASNEIFDALITAKPEPLYTDFTVLAREGKLKDISDIFPASAPLLYSKFTGEELSYASVDGRLYAVPSLFPLARCTYLLIDDALFRKYNMPDITDFDKYELFLETIKENEPDMTPGTITEYITTLQLFARASGYVIADTSKRLVYKWDDPEMKLIPWEKTPEFYEIMTRVIEWYKKGYIVQRPDWKKTASFVLEGLFTPFSEEPTTITFTDGATNEIWESNPMRAFNLYPDNYVQRENPMGNFFFNGSFIFPAASDNTERALQFLEWVHFSRENYYLVKYGIEGEDYILTDGIPAYPQGMDVFNGSYMYWDGNWAFENLEYAAEQLSNDAFGPEDFREFINRYSKYPPHGTFYPNYGPMTKAAEDRADIFNSFDLEFSRGQLSDIAEVDYLIKRLDDLGSDELAEAMHEQMVKK